MTRLINLRISMLVAPALLAFWALSYSFEALSAQSQPEPAFSSLSIPVEPNVSIHVADWGGEGPTLLYLPAWGTTSHVFDDFVPRFVDSYRVLVMDTRGHGLSSPVDHGYSIARMIQDIELVLDALDIEKVNLIALSRAGSLASHFAADYPDRVQSLVYLSGPIDRAHAREFYAIQENLFVAYRNSAMEEAIRALCYIGNEEYERPEGYIDEGADERGVEWRNNDPSPPYERIAAAVLAFWAPDRDRADRYREVCSQFSEWEVSRILIDRFERVSEPYFKLKDHDMEIFLTQLTDRQLIEVPGAHYHTFVSHPDFVERELRLFLEREN